MASPPSTSAERLSEESPNVSDLENHVWSKGDVCKAPYEGEFYKGFIKAFKQSALRKQALIHFRGCDSDEDEWIDTKLLRLHGQKSKPVVSPNREEQQEYLNKLYSQHNRQSTKNSDELNVHNRGVGLLEPSKTLSVVSGGLGSDSESEQTQESQGLKKKDNKYDRPNFGHKAPGDGVPFVLSDGEPVVQVPATINQYLRDYQREGISFLYGHYDKGEGAILGDDMGLGKTVQVIGLMAALLGKTGTREDIMRNRPEFIRKMSDNKDLYDTPATKKGPFLIIGPACVLHNWCDELETWGHFLVGRYHRGQKAQTVHDLGRGRLEVVVTTYETCRDNIDMLTTFGWEAIFVDEAHKVKGLKAEVSKALRKFSCLRRYGLTGTPLQNKLGEFWCILDWAIPECLGDTKHFYQNFIKKIDRGLKQDATKRELADARQAKARFTESRKKWFLRRTKSLIAHQLPSKDEQVVYCPPSDLQKEIYSSILEHEDVKTLLMGDYPCSCGSGQIRSKCCHKEFSDGRTVNQVTMTFMHLLMKAANHVALLLPSMTENKKQQEMYRRICQDVFEKHSHFVEQCQNASFRTLSDPKYCGKMKVLHELLKLFRKQKCKILLFSYSFKLLDILEDYVMGQGFEYRRMDGKTNDTKRQQYIKEFNTNHNVFLFMVTTKAGGVGLNLTGANVVIIFDPNWNPAHDLQAQDRAYRIGQRRDVRVYRLVTTGTIEENMYLRQVYKQQIGQVAIAGDNAVRYFHGIQGDKSNKGEIFGLQNIFKDITRSRGERCLTEDILKRNREIEKRLTERGYAMEAYVKAPTTEKEEEGSSYEGSDSDREGEEGEEEIEDDSEEFESRPSAFKRALGKGGICSGGGAIKSSPQPGPSRHRGGRRGTTSSPQPGPSGRRDPDSESDDSEKETPRKKQRRRYSNKPSEGQSEQRSIRKTRVRFTDHSGSDRQSLSDVFAPGLADRQSSPIRTLESVSDVFDRCGVVHTHRNRSVIGGSRVEDHVSRHAIQDVYELNQFSQLPAMDCQPCPESDGEQDKQQEKATKRKKEKAKKAAQKEPLSFIIGNKNILVGRTPAGVRDKHFRRLVKVMGCKDDLELAQRVLYSTTEEREAMIRLLYDITDFTGPGQGAGTSTGTGYKAASRLTGPGTSTTAVKGHSVISGKGKATQKRTGSPLKSGGSPNKKVPRPAEILYEDTDSDMNTLPGQSSSSMEAQTSLGTKKDDHKKEDLVVVNRSKQHEVVSQKTDSPRKKQRLSDDEDDIFASLFRSPPVKERKRKVSPSKKQRDKEEDAIFASLEATFFGF